MPRGIRSGLSFAEWPEEDRLLWQAAFETDDIFDDRDRGSHLAAATRANYLGEYGHWLSFVAQHHPDRLASRPADRVDPEIVAEYAERTSDSCRYRTVSTRIERLYRVLIAFDPDADHRWLYRLSLRVARQATVLPHRIAPADDLAALGYELMAQAVANADACGRISQEDAKKYRDGLMIALLAAVPVRRRTLAGLRIGEHLVRSGTGWQLDIPADLTKTGTALDYVLSDSLSASVDVFLERFRPSLLRRRETQGLLAIHPWSADGSQYHSAERDTTHGGRLRLLGQSASLPQRCRDLSLRPRSRECAGRQGPPRSRVLRDDGEALHRRAVAHRWPRPCRSRQAHRSCFRCVPTRARKGEWQPQSPAD